MRKLSSNSRSGLLRSSRAVVETCEERSLLNSPSLPVNSGNDQCEIRSSGSDTRAYFASNTSVTESPAGNFSLIRTIDFGLWVNLGPTVSLTSVSMSGVSMSGSSGSDSIIAKDWSAPSSFQGFNFSGGDGNDFFSGSSRADTASGGNGNDFITGAGGNDNLSGSADADTVIGDAGNDTVGGGPGNDFVSGGSGVDRIFGDSGNDRVASADGVTDLVVDGGTETDTLFNADASDPIQNIP
jgi:Ca2+-binding RTX toxin-like protein